jgi:hypothetical protein
MGMVTARSAVRPGQASARRCSPEPAAAEQQQQHDDDQDQAYGSLLLHAGHMNGRMRPQLT